MLMLIDPHPVADGHHLSDQASRL